MEKQKIILNGRPLFRALCFTKGGFTLVFAVLVAGFLAVIGASIVRLALKGFDLVSSSRESHAAFYAADAGVECAIYHDLQTGAFSEPAKEITPGPVVCDGQSAAIATAGAGTETIKNSFQFNFNNGACVMVDVYKNDMGRDGFNVKTTIMSRGRNSSCSSRRPIMVERGLKAEYSY